MNDKHFQKLEKMYLNANVNTMIFDTTTCKILDGYAEIGHVYVTKVKEMIISNKLYKYDNLQLD